MEIRVDPHTLERAEERGTNEEEIEDVLNTGFPIPAKYGRMGKAKIYDFHQERHGKHYEQKRVEVIYTLERCYHNRDGICLLWGMGRIRCRLCTMLRQTCSTFAWMNESSR